MPQLTHSFLPRAWGRANARSQSLARHSWVSRLPGVPHLTGKTPGEAMSASPAGRACPKPLNAARWRPLAPADPGALALRRRSAGLRPHRGRPRGRTPCGLAGGQGAGGLPRRPRGPQDGGGAGLSPPRRLSGSLPSPLQPGRAAADSEAWGRETQRGRGSDTRPGRGGGEHGPSTPPPPPPAGPSPARARPRQPTFEFEV